MANEIDWSQFSPVAQPAADQGVDWAQFEPEAPPGFENVEAGSQSAPLAQFNGERWLAGQLGATGEQPYGEGLGYAIDNPVTRGLAQAGNSMAAGTNELLNKLVVEPVANLFPNADIEESYRGSMLDPLTHDAEGLAAPKDAGVGSALLQAGSNIAGQVSGASLSGGPVRTAATMGALQAGDQTAQIESQGGHVSQAQVAEMAAAGTAANLIPVLGKGVARIPAGVASGVAGNELVNVAAGNAPGTGDVMAGLFGGALGAVPHAEALAGVHGPEAQGAAAADAIIASALAEQMPAQHAPTAERPAIVEPSAMHGESPEPTAENAVPDAVTFPDLAEPIQTADQAKASALRARLGDDVNAGKITPEHADVVAQYSEPVRRDTLTDLPTAEHHDDAIRRAQDWAERTEQPVSYMTFDLANLGGLNAEHGHTNANRFVRDLTGIIKNEFPESHAELFRNGGDEVAGPVYGIAPAQAEAIGQRIRARADEYQRANGLESTRNPKGGTAGTGIHFATSEIRPGRDVDKIAAQADTELEARKVGAASYGYGTRETAGIERPEAGQPRMAGPVGAQAEGSRGVARESGRGVRSAQAAEASGLAPRLVAERARQEAASADASREIAVDRGGYRQESEFGSDARARAGFGEIAARDPRAEDRSGMAGDSATRDPTFGEFGEDRGPSSEPLNLDIPIEGVGDLSHLPPRLREAARRQAIMHSRADAGPVLVGRERVDGNYREGYEQQPAMQEPARIENRNGTAALQAGYIGAKVSPRLSAEAERQPARTPPGQDNLPPRLRGNEPPRPPSGGSNDGASEHPSFAPVSEIWTGKRGKLARARVQIQDRMLAVRDQQRTIEDAGQLVTDAENVYRRENLMSGRAAKQTETFQREHVDPLYKDMAARKVSGPELEQFLRAMHAEERNRQIATINAKLPDAGSGMSTTDARQIIANAKANGRYEHLAAVADKVQRIVKGTREALRDANLITDTQKAAWERYEHYVPLRGRAGEGDAPMSNATSGGLEARSEVSKKALGRTTPPQNVLGEVIGDRQRAIILAEKERVAKALYELSSRHPNERVWEIDKIQTKRRLNPHTGMVETYYSDASAADSILVHHSDGTTSQITIHDPLLKDAIKTVNSDQMGPMLRMVSNVGRFIKQTYTSWSPDFMLGNPARDIQDALIRIGGTYENGPAIAKQYVRDWASAARAAYRETRGKAPRDEMGRYMEEFAEAGGKTGYVQHENVDQLARAFEGHVKRATDLASDNKIRQARAAMSEGGRSMLHFIESVNGAMENASRLSAYAALRRMGKSVEESAGMAKDLTVNFNRRGKLTSNLNAWKFFFNASMQGSHVLVKSLKSPRTWAIVGSLMGLRAGLTWLNMSKKDPDSGERYYDGIPESIKARNMIYVKDDGSYTKIPMPFGYSAFVYASDRVAQEAFRYAHKDSRHINPLKAGADIAGGFAAAFSPVNDNSLATWLAPSLVEPLVQAATNKSWAGGPVHPEQYDRSAPLASAYFASTGPAWITAARALNRIGGGDDQEKPQIPGFDWSPDDLRYIFQQYSGGVGSSLDRMVKAGDALARYGTTGEAGSFDVSDAPVARVFLAGNKRLRPEQTAYYDSLDTQQVWFKRLKDAGDDSDKEEAIRKAAGPYLDDVEVREDKSGKKRIWSGPDSLHQVANEAKRQLASLNDERRQAYADTEMHRYDRQHAIEDIEARMLEQYQTYNRAMNDAFND